MSEAGSLPEASVVIPTRDRRERVLGLLERLARQTVAPGRFEVIVVADGCTDGTADAAREAGRRLALSLRVIENARPSGPGAARNAGVALARGAVLAFADDDVEIEPGWLAAGLAGFTAPDVGGVEGRTEPALGHESLYKGNVVNLEGGRYPTCNIFYRRAVFEAVGRFDERLTRSREDTDLAFRVLDAGHRIAFAPAALVRHRSHRSSVLRPLEMASTLPENVYLWAKHPGRRDVRPRVYLSDVIKVGLAALAVAAALTGHPTFALALALAFLALTLRTMARELVLRRALRPDRAIALLAVYSVLPFANLGFIAWGKLRVRRQA